MTPHQPPRRLIRDLIIVAIQATQDKRARLRQHLSGMTVVEVQRLYMMSLPYPKDDMIETIVDCTRDEHLDAMLNSFEGDSEAARCEEVSNG